jgi:hypothetical protein
MEFAETLVPFVGVTVIVKVEDTRRADAPAVLIAEWRIRSVSRSPGRRDPVPFAIECLAGGELTRCAFRVHDEADATDHISPGGYVSTQCYPLAGVAPLDRLVVRVASVR